jgi:hypothetical protein
MDRAGGVFDVAGGEEGYVAATGESLWRSVDGRRWTRAAASGRAEDLVTDVEASDAGFIGLGIRGPTPAIWVAGPDGSVWERQPDDPALAGLWEAELRANGPDVAAVGLRDGDARIPTAWLFDGTTWSAETVTSTTGARPADLVTTADAIVVVGSVPTPDGATSAAAWRRPVGSG